LIFLVGFDDFLFVNIFKKKKKEKYSNALRGGGRRGLKGGEMRVD